MRATGSSPTSWPASTRSSTSESALPRGHSLAGLLRVVHPFPSALDAVASIAIALIAGARPGVALGLGMAMLCLQFAIGSANDYADAPSDAAAKPRKPIPAGLLSRRAAGAISVLMASAGLLVAASVGPAALGVGVCGLGLGLAYDFRLKGTPFSWVAFAIGVGLLPLYAWLGARGSVPAGLAGVIALAVVAGSALAIANAYADMEADGLSGTESVATLIGPTATLRTDAGLLVIVQAIVLGTTVAAAPGPVLGVEAAGCVLAWLGIGLAVVRGGKAGAVMWELQALGIVALGAGWLAALSSAGLLNG
jgi:heme o synthase